MKTFISFIIQVYKEKLENGTLTDYAEVQVIADTEEEALKKAQKLLVRDGYIYRLKQINEYEKVAKN